MTGPRLMCQVPHPKHKAVVSTPAPPVVPPDVAYAAPAKPAAVVALSASAAALVVTSTYFANGLLIDIARIAVDDLGSQCREHKV